MGEEKLPGPIADGPPLHFKESNSVFERQDNGRLGKYSTKWLLRYF